MSLASLRDLLRDERVAAVRARVALHDDHRQGHYDVNDEGHLIVSVLTLQHEVPIWAELSGGFGGGNGVWSIPALDAEVLVLFDDGDFEGDGVVVPVGASAPTNLVPGKIFILADEIQVRAPDGTARSLAFKDELQTVVDELHEHDHVYIPGSGLPAHTTGNPTVTSPQGTTKLKAQ